MNVFYLYLLTTDYQALNFAPSNEKKPTVPNTIIFNIKNPSFSYGLFKNHRCPLQGRKGRC